jgi:hypothetical protein
MAPYDGLSDPDRFELDFMPVWLRVHKIPEGYRKEEVVKKIISRSAGEIIKVEMKPIGGFRGDYVRVTVKHDVRKPLTRFVSIVLANKRNLFEVKYEKLGQICFACGLIGHDFKECGDGMFDEAKLKFGEWLHAEPTGRGRGGYGQGGLRGGSAQAMQGGRGESPIGHGRGDFGENPGRGRGNFVDWRDHPERNGRNTDIELSDTATSPIKNGSIHMQVGDSTGSGAKRNIDFTDMDGVVNAVEDNVPVAMVTDGNTLPNALIPNLGDGKDRKKRSKKTGADSSSIGSASSQEGLDRSQ